MCLVYFRWIQDPQKLSITKEYLYKYYYLLSLVLQYEELSVDSSQTILIIK